jgi:HD-like signal output (HDOD) protein
MDDSIITLLLAAAGIPALVSLALFLLIKLHRDRRAVIVTPMNLEGALGVREQAFTVQSRFVPPVPEAREDIDLCLARIFTKAVVSDQYAEAVQEEIPGFVLKQLDKIIDQCAYFKHAYDILGKIDALEGKLEELVDLVATDPMLYTAVLRQANAACYGAGGEVTSLKFAVEMLGLSNLKNLVYREYVLRQHRGKAIPDQDLLMAILEHSLLCATAAAFLAPAFPGLDSAEAYTVGLLHDIGKYLLMSSELLDLGPDRCMRPYCGGFSRDTALIWRYDHALAGKIAALKWGFGPEMAKAIGMHHYPALVNLSHVRADHQLTNTLMLAHVANQVAKHFSRQGRAANFIVPLHFSYHGLVDTGALRAVLAGSALLPELARIKSSLTAGSA